MIITTSWDDGHPLDMKLVKLLNKYGIKATFYIPLSNSENQVMHKEMIKEISNSHEIGGHTINHTFLNKLNYKKAKYQIVGCKDQLENIIQKEISAFCFPGGYYSKRDIDLLIESGFSFGRTTRLFSTKINNESSLLHTTIQVYNHNYINLVKHSIKRLLINDLIKCNAFIPYDKDFKNLSYHFLNNNSTKIFHMWGHSWEIEKYNLWDELDFFLKYLSNIPDAIFVDNSECWKYSKIKK